MINGEKYIKNGTKFYKSDTDLRSALDSVIRIKKGDYEAKTYTAIDTKGNLIHLTEDEINRDWTKLNPDAMLMLCIVEYDDLADVLVCIHKKDGAAFSPVPDIVCRQNIVDIYSGNANTIGMCISNKTKLNGIEFKDMLQYNEMKAMYISMLYMDDTIDDILAFTNARRADKVLQRLAENHYGKFNRGKIPAIKGVCKSLKELLMDNQFMMDYHMLFDIIEVPFSIKWKELVSENSRIIIRKALIDIIAESTRKVPSAIYVFPYYKSIDLSKFEREYILVTADPTRAKEDDRDIYIVGYDVNENMSYTEYKYGSVENLKQLINDIGFS